MKTFAQPPGVRRNGRGAAALGAVVALAAACGSQVAAADPGGSGSVPSTPRSSSLTITVAASRHAIPRRWTLTCGPAGDHGTHPQPALACAALTRAKEPFAPVRVGVMCSMIYGGPQIASITGTWDGTRVAATYSRVNGCQIQRWDKIGKVLGPINPGGPMIPAPG